MHFMNNRFRENQRPRLIAAFLAAFISLADLHAQQPGRSNTEQAFFDAIKNGNSTTVAELLKQQPALIGATRNGITPVLYAVYAKHREIAESLIARGVEVNVFEAAATGRIDRVRDFLKKDPSVIRAFSPDGWTVLHLNFNNLEMAKFLIDAGADLNLNSRNKFNATPLQGAAANNWIELAKLYLSRGANVNCLGEGGGTPLHEAAANGYLDFARLLIEYHADTSAKDDQGKTPFTIALEYKHPDMASFLREHGAAE